METKQFQKWLNSYSVKMVIVAVLALFLLIPTVWIQEIIKERIALKNKVEADLCQLWGASQVVAGPVLNVPYTYLQSKDNNEGFVEYSSTAHFLPESLKVQVELIPEIRYRGIYKMPVYESHIRMKGHINRANFAQLGIDANRIDWDDAYFTMGITDLRGIKDTVLMKMNQLSTSVEPGLPDSDLFTSGITLKTNSPLQDQDLDFEVQFILNGSSGLSVEPLGKSTEVSMQSSWIDPSFTGAFLPDNREVNNDGFTAKWLVTHLNRNYPQHWTGKKYKTEESAFGVSLLMPVDHYQKATRSVKYAILFIALNFIVFLFIEIRNKKRIHPFQYSLVAFALLLFYTLLVSIGEQIGFNAAFAISAIAVTALVSWYARSILGAIKPTLWITGLQLALYLFLFTILQLQDYALLMGSIGLFVILGLIMKASQQIKWYSE